MRRAAIVTAITAAISLAPTAVWAHSHSPCLNGTGKSAGDRPATGSPVYYIADPLSNYPVVLGVDDGDTDGDNKSEFGYLEVDGQAGAANIRGDLAPQGVAGEHDLHVSFNVAVGANTANPTSPVGGFYCVDTGDGEVIFGPIGSVPPLPVPVPPVGVPDLPLPV